MNVPIICMFRGIKISINWREHQPPHFHAALHQDELLENWNLAQEQQELFLSHLQKSKTSAVSM